MSSIIPGFEYDVFISYRQNDNRTGWVTDFVNALQEELAATTKEPLSIYFDKNPHDGLLETHQVDQSLEGKLKCALFIPILSRTYCDAKCYAWNHEFLAFRDLIGADGHGSRIKLGNGNVASRILPVLIHDLVKQDQELFEKESKGVLRAVDFTFRSPGVNRPLLPEDERNDNQARTVYRDQINKIANAAAEMIQALAAVPGVTVSNVSLSETKVEKPASRDINWFLSELVRRNVIRAGIAYAATAWVLREVVAPWLIKGDEGLDLLTAVLAGAFPLALILAWLYERSPQGMIRTNTRASTLNPFRASQKKPFTSGWLIVVLVGLLVMQRYGPELFPAEKSIAVLPFENRSEAREDEYFADGLTDEIIQNLSNISKLRVMSRASINSYRGKGHDYRKIAEELGVVTLLTGSIQRIGTDLRITASLIRGSTQEFIWGETFQREMKDLGMIESEISKRIASHLSIKLDETEEHKLGRLPTLDYTAHEYYLTGRGLYYKYTPERNDEAITFFRKAIALDPRYSLAWAGLGDAYSQRGGRFGQDRQWLDSSIVAGTRAIELDSGSADAYKALANAYNYLRQYDKGFMLLKKAVLLNPAHAPSIGNLGTAYHNRGFLAENILWQKKSASLNPKSYIPYQLTGWTYRLLGEYEEAERWLGKSMQLDSSVYDTYEQMGYTFFGEEENQEALKLIPHLIAKCKEESRKQEVAGLLYHFAGEKEKAAASFKLAIESNPSYATDHNSVSAIGYGQLLLEKGDRVMADVYLTHAEEVFTREMEKGAQGFNLPFYLSAVNAIRGKREASLQWLQKAIDSGWTDLIQFSKGPWFINYHNDPDFLKKAEQVKTKVARMREEAHKY